MQTITSIDEIGRATGLRHENIIEIKNFSVYFNRFRALEDVTLRFRRNKITCIVGPSGSGKSTLVRSLNRINDEIGGFRHSGSIAFYGSEIYGWRCDANALRTRIGMVFQKPCIFPKSIFENVLFGIRHQRKLSQRQKREIVEENLRAVALWDEVADRIHEQATALSLGQQQRLCLARTLAVQPEVLLLDEPTSSLDPLSSKAIELLMLQLKQQYTIIFVTHNIQQARRLADDVVFLCLGKVIESGAKEKMFSCPEKPETREYLTSEYCDCH